MNLDDIRDRSNKNIQFEISEKKEHKIVLDNGLIRLPNGNTYKINIQLNNSTTSLSKDQEAIITQSVMELLNKSENHANYKDLKNTVITHEGIKTDQFVEKEGGLSITTSEKIEDVATNIIIPETIVDFSSTLEKIVFIAASKTFLPPLETESFSGIKDDIVIKFNKLEKQDDIAESPQPIKEKQETTNKASKIFENFRSSFSKRLRKTKRSVRKKFTHVSNKLKIRNRTKSSPAKNVQPKNQIKTPFESEESKVINKTSLSNINTKIKELGKDKKIRIENGQMIIKNRTAISTRSGKKQKTIDIMSAILSKMQISATNTLSNYNTLDGIQNAIKTKNEVNDLIHSIENNKWTKNVIANNKKLKNSFDKIKELSSKDLEFNTISSVIEKSKESIPIHFGNSKLEEIEDHLINLNKIQEVITLVEENDPSKIGLLEKPIDRGKRMVDDVINKINSSQQGIIEGLNDPQLDVFGKSMEDLNRIDRIVSLITNGAWAREVYDADDYSVKELKGIPQKIDEALKENGDELIMEMMINTFDSLTKSIKELGSPLNENQNIPIETIQKNLENIKTSEKFMKSIQESKWIKNNNFSNGLDAIEHYTKEITPLINNFNKDRRLKTMFNIILKPEQSVYRKQFLTGYRELYTTNELFSGLRNDFLIAAKSLESAKTKQADEKGNITVRINFEEKSVNKAAFIQQMETRQKEILSICKEWLKTPFINSGEDVPKDLTELLKSNNEENVDRISNIANESPVSEKDTDYFATKIKKLASGELKEEEERSNLMEEMSEGLLNRNMQLLSQINSKEFVGSQFSDKEKTPNLSKMTQESTQLSNFVTLSILIPTPIQKGENDTDKMLVNRAKTIEFFIDLASLCLQKGDFSSAIAINGGLNNASVQRLSDTQEKIDHKHKKDFNTLNELTKKNYKSLRSQVAERQKNNMPYIPFLGVTNTDYTFSSDGNPKIVDGQIYKGRIEATSNALAEIEKPQEMIKNFQTKNTGNKPQQNIMSVINLDTTALSKKLLDENSNIILPEKIENLNKFVDEQSLIIQPRKQK